MGGINVAMRVSMTTCTVGGHRCSMLRKCTPKSSIRKCIEKEISKNMGKKQMVFSA
jgi:hypothetical protein